MTPGTVGWASMVQVWKRFHALDVREKGKQPVWLQRSLGAYSCLATDPDAAQEPALLLEVAQVYVCMGAVDGAVAIDFDQCFCFHLLLLSN